MTERSNIMSTAEQLADELDSLYSHIYHCEKAAAELRRPAAENAALRGALGKLIDYSTGQLCTHDDTYRGGAIWEVCRQCGAKWADDEGGRPEWDEPKQIKAARAAMKETP